MRAPFCAIGLLVTLSLYGCATAPQKANYAQFRAENPRSVLIVPVTNKTVQVDAPDYFLSTISKPVADRGYYVFPVNLVRGVLADGGLNDADLVHAADPRRLGQMFGADSVMYISIERWDAKYAVLATTVTVELDFSLKSARTGAELWHNHQIMKYAPQQSSAGGLAGLVADAVQAAITKAAPNYMPLAREADVKAVSTRGAGLPAGPHDGMYLKDTADF